MSRILMTGASGLVGSALVPRLRSRGHEVLRLVRRPATAADELTWDPVNGRFDSDLFEEVSGIVHLAGENIAGGRWNERQKEKIRASRVRGTFLLAEALAGLAEPPKVFVSASAIGYYGDGGDALQGEDQDPGDGFLAEVCRQWEAAADPARQVGIRVVHPRIGVVLSPEGGALSRMLPPFRLGAGGILGTGKQYVSWISLEDLVRGLVHLLEGDLEGPVNLVAPKPVTNRELTRALGKILRRPTVMPVPAFALRLTLGEMAEELLLASCRADVSRLLESGFHFHHEEIEAALGELLGESGESSS